MRHVERGRLRLQRHARHELHFRPHSPLDNGLDPFKLARMSWFRRHRGLVQTLVIFALVFGAITCATLAFAMEAPANGAVTIESALAGLDGVVICKDAKTGAGEASHTPATHVSCHCCDCQMPAHGALASAPPLGGAALEFALRTAPAIEVPQLGPSGRLFIGGVGGRAPPVS